MTAQGGRAEPAAAAHPASVRVAFAALVLAMLPAVLDQTILATALPTIAGDLGRLSDVSWVVTAHVVAGAPAPPLWGKRGARPAPKPPLEGALALFLAASAACGLARGIAFLIVARAVQGVAAGGLMSLAMAAVGDLVAPRERGRYQGYIAAAFAVATVAGPLIGGLLVDHASWRWVFYVNLPLGLAALVGLHARLPRNETAPARGPLDLLGAALLGAATSAFMLACLYGSAPLFAAAAGLAALLALRERRARDPVVPLDLLRTRTVAVASAALFLTTGALFAVNVFVPVFLQTTTGASPTESGLLLVPMMIGITVSTNLAGRALQRGARYKPFPVAGLALMTVALLSLAVAAGHPSRVTTGLALVLFGCGFGMVGQVLTVAVQNAVDRRRLGSAMATTSFARGLGGAVGAAAVAAVFSARGSSAGAIQTVFLAAAPVAALALLVVLALREDRTTAPAR